MGKAEVSLTVTVDEDELYGDELEAEIRQRLNDAFDNTEKESIYLL